MTWSNQHTHCKLDRTAVIDKRMTLLQDSIVDFGTPCISDHSPVVLRLLNAVKASQISFMFNNIQLEDPRFFHIVTGVQQDDVQGCVMYNLVTKMVKMENVFPV